MAVDHNNPQSRDEEILIATIDGNEYNKAPQSRMEELLLELKEAIEEGGGGGTTDYENLSNQPQVNGETLIGDKTGAELGLVDAEEGKGLSTNDYDDTEKAAVAAATSAISDMKDGTDIDSFGDVEVALLDKADISDLGTAAAKDSTNAVTAGSTDLVESGAVKSAIDSAVSKCYHHAGTKTVAQLTHDLLVAANEGNVYEMTDSGTTTSDFIEGMGRPIKEGDNVGIARVSEGVYKFDLLSGFVDTTNFVQKSQTAGLLQNNGTVDTTIQSDVSTLESNFTKLSEEVNGSATTYPYADVITINDAVPANLADCSVKVEPVQDLHGYDKPWVGGAEKNKLPLTVASIKADNTTGTWTGNVYALNNLTFEILTDESEVNVHGIKVSGTNGNSLTYFKVGSFVGDGTSYILNGCPENGSTSTYTDFIEFTSANYDNGSGVTFNDSGAGNVYIRINSQYAIQTGGITFYPMIRLSTETDATFAPYTNICPITGHTEASVKVEGKNKLPSLTLAELKEINGASWTWNGNSATKGNITFNCDFDDNGRLTTVSCTAGTAGSNIDFLIYEGQDMSVFSNMVLNGAPTGSNMPVMRLSADGTNYDTNNGVLNIGLISGSGYISLRYTATLTYSAAIFRPMISLSGGDFEPYQKHTATIQLGSTIYGGTVDFDSGVMTVTHGFEVLDGSVDEGWYLSSGNKRVNSNIIRSAVKSPASNTEVANIISSQFVAVTANDAYNGVEGICVDSSGVLGVHNGGLDVVMTIDSWETYLASNPLQVCYELATPTTIQLTPQQIQLLQGTNTLYASTGDISVTVNGVSGSIGALQEQVNDHEERIETVESGVAVVDVSSGITANDTYVESLDTKAVYKIGRLVVGCIRLHLLDALAADGQTLLTGLPASADNYIYLSASAVGTSANPSGHTRIVTITSNGEMKNNWRPVPKDEYVINFSYIAAT